MDATTREMVDLLSSAPAEQDMSVEGDRRFAELLRSESELLLLEREYWALAVRDAKLRTRYAKRRAELRRALGRALAVRLDHLGGPPLEDPDGMATVLRASSPGSHRSG